MNEESSLIISDRAQVMTYSSSKAHKLKKKIREERKGVRHRAMSKLLEQILSDENIEKAYKAVYANRGSAGVDSMSVYELEDYLKENIDSIRDLIRKREYYPLPVRRVEIPKPNGKKRKLGIPAVIDRVIQQAMVQVLSPMCEPYFSEYSYGFRENRSCEKAILKVLEYLNDGYDYIVDIDLEKFFDNVPHDKLMSFVHNIINDGDVESLIYKFLKADVMIEGKRMKNEVGTPQGGNLSPLLSNIILNELDKELEARGLRFTRYADDCVILTGSSSAANRVMKSITSWIERKLSLKVNMTKTKVTRPSGLKYLGFGFYYDRKTGSYKARPHEESVSKFMRSLKKLTSRSWSIGFKERIERLNQVIRGWINYFAIADMKILLKNRISPHLRTRLRIVLWKQWKVPSRRQWALQKLGINKDLARLTSYCGNRYYWVVTRTCVSRAISKEKLSRAGLVDPLDYYITRHSLKQNLI